MSFVEISKDNGIATLALNRGKVNAINLEMVHQITDGFRELEGEGSIKSVIFTGSGKFFSFGFDIPELLEYSREELITFLTDFTGLYTYIYLFPRPVIGTLNGHTIAGGCMLALACDIRIMVSGNAKIALNEVNIGASLFAGSVEMLRATVSGRAVNEIVLGGQMYKAEEALKLGLIDKISTEERVIEDARELAREYAAKNPAAFKSIKMLVRRPVADLMVRREKDSIDEFADIWCSEESRKILREVKIRS
jgi:enoyl-CoA hydratase/carnithine racemase